MADLQSWDCKIHFGHLSSIDLSMELVGLANEDNNNLVDDINVEPMANLICMPLTYGCFQCRAGGQPNTRAPTVLETNAKPIFQITEPEKSIHYPKEPEKHPRACQQSCYVCHHYSVEFFNAQWLCRDCGMHICQISRVDKNADRQYSCIVEHTLSGNMVIGCG